MLSTFLDPYSVSYLLAKFIILAIVLLLWFTLTTAPVV